MESAFIPQNAPPPGPAKRGLAHVLLLSLAIGAPLSVAVGIAVFVLGDGVASPGEWLLPAVTFMAVSLVVHECAHALVGGLLGFHLDEIRIGSGPKILRVKARSTMVDVRLFPTFGFVRQSTTSDVHLRRHLVAVYAAGPVGSFVTAVAFVLLAPGPWKVAAALIGAVKVIGNVAPREFDREGLRWRTDGLRILDVCRNPTDRQRAAPESGSGEGDELFETVGPADDAFGGPVRRVPDRE